MQIQQWVLSLPILRTAIVYHLVSQNNFYFRKENTDLRITDIFKEQPFSYKI